MFWQCVDNVAQSYWVVVSIKGLLPCTNFFIDMYYFSVFIECFDEANHQMTSIEECLASLFDLLTGIQSCPGIESSLVLVYVCVYECWGQRKIFSQSSGSIYLVKMESFIGQSTVNAQAPLTVSRWVFHYPGFGQETPGIFLFLPSQGCDKKCTRPYPSLKKLLHFKTCLCSQMCAWAWYRVHVFIRGEHVGVTFLFSLWTSWVSYSGLSSGLAVGAFRIEPSHPVQN